ncbi:TRAP transporter large permease [Shinella sp. S4-D37]|uniref:TRAP transporter large permease n=1 Tax=Shinella sp. S4-D37 TaxID=3161999 RepID=UPI00346739BA
MALVSGVPQWGIGIAYCVATLVVMFSGMPIAFALGVVAVSFMIFFMPAASVDTIAQNFYEELANVIILAIPLFILKGAAIGRSDAGKDLYSALHAWLYKIPGGLGIANTVACGLFAAMAGSSPATCSAIGSAGIPEMRARGYSGGFAAGIIAAGGTLGILLPPSVTMLLYAVAAEVSLGKLFLAGIGPGLLLILMFAGYSMLRYSKEKQQALAQVHVSGAPKSALLAEEHYTLGEKIRMITWVAPFVLILAGVMVVLYAGWATPSETAGVGAVLAFLVIGAMYRLWQPSKIMPIVSGTLRESTMLLMIIGMSLIYSYVMSYLHISQATAAWIIDLDLSKWVLLAAILSFVIVLGFFLPPVSIILMTAPIILPPLKAAGFDLIWFGVVMTIVMEMGLIHPPVGLNIFVIKNIAPDISLSEIMWGTLPFVILMAIAVVIVCFMPGIVTWLPDTIMGG